MPDFFNFHSVIVTALQTVDADSSCIDAGNGPFLSFNKFCLREPDICLVEKLKTCPKECFQSFLKCLSLRS